MINGDIKKEKCVFKKRIMRSFYLFILNFFQVFVSNGGKCIGGVWFVVWCAIQLLHVVEFLF
jgi:hypothetical protein